MLRKTPVRASGELCPSRVYVHDFIYPGNYNINAMQRQYFINVPVVKDRVVALKVYPAGGAFNEIAFSVWGWLITLKDYRGVKLLDRCLANDLMTDYFTPNANGNYGKTRQFNLEGVDWKESYIQHTQFGSFPPANILLMRLAIYWE